MKRFALVVAIIALMLVVPKPAAAPNRYIVRSTGGLSSVLNLCNLLHCQVQGGLDGQVDIDRPFSDSLSSVHQATMDCFANAMPFVELVPALGERSAPGHNPVFEVRFALQNHPVPDVALHGLSARLRMRSTGTARFHLGCEITVMENGLEVVWLARLSLFPLAEIKNLSYIFQAVLAESCRSPESRIAALMV